MLGAVSVFRATEEVDASAATVATLNYSRWKQSAEIAIAFASIQATLWTTGELRLCFHVFAVAWILGTTLLHRNEISSLGLRTTISALRSSAWVIWISIALAIGFAVTAEFAGTLHSGITAPGLGIQLTAYSLWALIQQFIAQSYFFIRFESLLGSGKRAVLPTAVLFAAAHLPNPVLVFATGIGGLVLTEVFRRYRTLYTIAVAHAVIGVAITQCVPDDVHRHMRVGIGYFHYRMGSRAKAAVLPRADRLLMLSEPSGPEHVHQSVSNG